jgi:hypothetical protein
VLRATPGRVAPQASRPLRLSLTQSKSRFGRDIRETLGLDDCATPVVFANADIPAPWRRWWSCDSLASPRRREIRTIGDQDQQ